MGRNEGLITVFLRIKNLPQNKSKGGFSEKINYFAAAKLAATLSQFTTAQKAAM